MTGFQDIIRAHLIARPIPYIDCRAQVGQYVSETGLGWFALCALTAQGPETLQPPVLIAKYDDKGCGTALPYIEGLDVARRGTGSALFPRIQPGHLPSLEPPPHPGPRLSILGSSCRYYG